MSGTDSKKSGNAGAAETAARPASSAQTGTRRGVATSGFAAWADAVRHDKRAAFGAGVIGFFILVAVLGPLFVGDPTELVGIPMQPPSADHWLGTTGQGQDVLAQLVVGTRWSLLIGFSVGLTVVFVGGRVDAILSLLFNVFLVIPGLPLAIVIAAYLPSGPLTLGFVLVIAGWAWNARVLRAQTLAHRNRDFVAAAVVAGESSWRIVTSEILPNMTSLIVSQVIGGTVYAIGAQVGLEFLGLGDVSAVTWGTNLYWAQNDSALLTGAWWTFAPTGLAVALVGFGLTMLNSGFDEITNPRLRLERAWRAFLIGHGRLPGRSTPVVRETVPAQAGEALGGMAGDNV
jgi:peptide/nickel transport system permease protein